MKPNPLQDIGLLLLRIGLGLVTLYYGCQLLMGTFGGEGFTAALDRFHEKMGIPIVFGTMCVIAESFGALAVIVGLLTRLAAIGLAINFGAAVYFGTKVGDTGLVTGDGASLAQTRLADWLASQ